MPKAKTQERKETSGKDLTKHQRYYRRHASNRKKQAREYYRSTKTVAAGRKQEPIESDEEESNESESSAGEQQHIHNQKPEARQEEPDSDSNDDDSPSKEYRSVSVQTRHQSPLVIQKFRGTAEDANAEFKAILLLPNGEDYPGYFLYLVLLNDKYYDWTHAHGGMAQWRKLRGDAGDDDASIYELHAQAGKELANEIRSTLEFGALWTVYKDIVAILLVPGQPRPQPLSIPRIRCDIDGPIIGDIDKILQEVKDLHGISHLYPIIHKKYLDVTLADMSHNVRFWVFGWGEPDQPLHIDVCDRVSCQRGLDYAFWRTPIVGVLVSADGELQDVQAEDDIVALMLYFKTKACPHD
ncbi:hypothetical protein EV361DRAFT_956190 [Lentinula raphanica]|nr:hypothetical protein EV361DRAFT_956190 [Lentinula raphanica]